MIRLLIALYGSPDAERDPEAWATRFMAHLGLGVVLWLILSGIIGPTWAAGICGVIYAAFEILQWPGGRRMAFDGIVDSVAFWTGLAGLWAVAHGQDLAASGCGLAALLIVWVGAWRRT